MQQMALQPMENLLMRLSTNQKRPGEKINVIKHAASFSETFRLTPSWSIWKMYFLYFNTKIHTLLFLFRYVSSIQAI